MFHMLCLQMLNSELQIMQNPSFKVCGQELCKMQKHTHTHNTHKRRNIIHTATTTQYNITQHLTLTITLVLKI
jgi:hypothetical protein